MPKTIVAALAMLAAGIAGTGHSADLPPEKASFVADGTIQIGEDRLTFDVYHLGGKERQEMTIDGLYQITIFRPDLGKAFLVQPEAEAFIPLTIDEVGIWPRYRAMDGYRIELRGKETLGDEETSVYHVTSSEDAPVAMDVIVWITNDGIEMRMEGEMEVEGLLESVVLERSNIRRAPLDDKLFDPKAALADPVPGIAVPASHEKVGKIGP